MSRQRLNPGVIIRSRRTERLNPSKNCPFVARLIVVDPLIFCILLSQGEEPRKNAGREKGQEIVTFVSPWKDASRDVPSTHSLWKSATQPPIYILYRLLLYCITKISIVRSGNCPTNRLAPIDSDSMCCCSSQKSRSPSPSAKCGVKKHAMARPGCQ